MSDLEPARTENLARAAESRTDVRPEDMQAGSLRARDEELVTVSELAGRLRGYSRRLWLLDYDGTLAPIVSRPEDAKISGDALDALISLSRAEGDTLAIVSGRSIAQLSSFLAPLTSERAIFCGLHGGEMIEWPSGKVLFGPDPSLAVKLASFEEALVRHLAASGLEARGIALESKTYSLAMHYRNAIDQGAAAEAIDAFHRAALEAGAIGEFAVRSGKMVVELVPAAFNKGAAASYLLERSRDSDGVAAHPVCAGDDLTDEHAFEAVLSADPEATAIRIGKDERPSAARYRLESPSDTSELIAALAERQPRAAA